MEDPPKSCEPKREWAGHPAVPYADLADPQSLNLYGYVRNNPMTRRDADGHCCDLEPAIEEVDKVVRPLIESAAVSTERALLGTVVGVVGIVFTPMSASSDHELQMEQQMRQQGETNQESAEPEASTSGSGARSGGGLRRPYVRKGTREAVEAAAPRTTDGKPIDPNTLQPIEGTADLGHKPGHEHRTEKAKAEAEGLDQKQFNERMNDPNKYQLENPSANRSHKYEKKDSK